MRGFAFGLALAALPVTAFAQGPDDFAAAPDPQTTAPPPEVGAAPGNPREEAGKDYFFVGARYRLLIVPTWLVNLFAEVEDWGGGLNHAFGPEFTYRKDGFDITGAIWWAGYAAERGFFRGSGDPVTSMEAIDSSLSALIFSADFVWSYKFSDIVSFTYGVEIGFAPIFGSLNRQEAYEDGSGWHRCPGFDPSRGDNPEYCEEGPPNGGGTYGVDENASGGDVPSVVPWAALLRLGLRIKPHRNFMARVDLGFGVGFFLGLSANYGI